MPKELAQSILPWIGKTGKMLHVFMVEKFKEHNTNLTFEQFIILRILHENDKQSQQELAMVTRRHKASLTRILGTLERKNLIARIPDPEDKRINRIYLTTHGRKFYAPLKPVLDEAIGQVQEGLSKKEIETLIHLIQKVQKNLMKSL